MPLYYDAQFSFSLKFCRNVRILNCCSEVPFQTCLKMDLLYFINGRLVVNQILPFYTTAHKFLLWNIVKWVLQWTLYLRHSSTILITVIQLCVWMHIYMKLHLVFYNCSRYWEIELAVRAIRGKNPLYLPVVDIAPPGIKLGLSNATNWQH